MLPSTPTLSPAPADPSLSAVLNSLLANEHSCPRWPHSFLVSVKNRDLWPDSIFWACAECSFRILSHSFRNLTGSQWKEDFRCWTRPEIAILDANKNEHVPLETKMANVPANKGLYLDLWAPEAWNPEWRFPFRSHGKRVARLIFASWQWRRATQ